MRLITTALVLLLRRTHGQIEDAFRCLKDEECLQRYNGAPSYCIAETGTCANPFRMGCLYARLGESWGRKRVCNSDDVAGKDDCRRPEFDAYLPKPYPEIRIHNADWESSIFMSWIYQVILMELADVGATVGLRTQVTATTSFYNLQNQGLLFSQEQYPWDALARGNGMRDCSSTSLPCVHFLPEVWTSGSKEYIELLEVDAMEPLAPNGLLGNSGLKIPLFTTETYPELSVWFGWAGEERRRFLAETFKRPVTWSFYCDYISPTRCKEGDSRVARSPSSSEEGGRYFVPGLYEGYFHASDMNNCTQNPTSCTGAVIGPPCEWNAYVEGQLYHNNIVGLGLGGPLEPNHGYAGHQMREIWQAANATRSHVLLYWYEPDPMPVQFKDTDYEFFSVALPTPSYECEINRPTMEERCSSDISERRGDPAGACMDSILPLSFAIAKLIGHSTMEVEESDRSPAYDLLRNIKVTNLDMDQIMLSWNDGSDPREAVCDWVVGNLDRLQAFVPPGYPREISTRSDYTAWYLHMAQGLGGFIGLLAVVALVLCYKFRETKTMAFTQPLFMMLILFGFCLTCAGAVLLAMKPSYSVCNGSSWLIFQGFTIGLGAVLVKTAAINQLVQSSKKMKRVSIRRDVMLIKVLGLVLVVAACIITWMRLDPVVAQTSRMLIQDNDSIFLEIDVKCASESEAWLLTGFGWQLILLILAAVLAYQSRSAMEQLNESKSLAVMVYVHFLFVCLRGVTAFLYVYNIVAGCVTATMFSLNYSLDALCAMSIYVFPKIYQAWRSPGDYIPGRYFTSGRDSGFKGDSIVDDIEFSHSMMEISNENLQILVCSANIGNAEPTLDSIEAWIPTGGSCSWVNPIPGAAPLEGTFDLIAIGMQEATWTSVTSSWTSMTGSLRSSGRTKSSTRGTLTEEEIFAALEESNTATLREMIQETLGDAYRQVIDEQRGQMRLHFWVKRTILKDISSIRISGLNTGIGNVLANKGGIVGSLCYKKTRLSFLSAHLAAHEGDYYYKTRCNNIESILREAKTFNLTKKFDESTTSHHMFVFGDLNFRTSFGTESKHEDNFRRARELISSGNYRSLYLFDELQTGLADRDLLVGFQTLECNFPPTFKVERQHGFAYKEQRTPSFTDRILFKSAEGLSDNLKPLAYEACANFITSDHKPIRGAFSIKPNDDMNDLRLIGDLEIVFRKLRCSNLPAGDSDGKSDPYVMVLWDSVDLHTDNNAFMDKLRELWIGHSWPRTKYISKTLNPYWKGERVRLRASDTSIGHGAMLFIAVIDYDVVGTDDLLGGTALNVLDLVKMSPGETTKTLRIDRDLTNNGKLAGRIKFSVDVTRTMHLQRPSAIYLPGLSGFRRSARNLRKPAQTLASSSQGVEPTRDE